MLSFWGWLAEQPFSDSDGLAPFVDEESRISLTGRPLSELETSRFVRADYPAERTVLVLGCQHEDDPFSGAMGQLCRAVHSGGNGRGGEPRWQEPYRPETLPNQRAAL